MYHSITNALLIQCINNPCIHRAKMTLLDWDYDRKYGRNRYPTKWAYKWQTMRDRQKALSHFQH